MPNNQTVIYVVYWNLGNETYEVTVSQASLTQFSCVVIHLRNKIYLVFPLYIMRTLFNRQYIPDVWVI